MLLGEEEISKEELWKSESLKIAYLSQDFHNLPGEKTAIDTLGLSHRSEIFRARTILANLGLKEDKILQKINSLSLGERIRVKLTDILMPEEEKYNELDKKFEELMEKKKRLLG